jgi:enolase
MKISKLLGYQILDSRGRPTVAVTLSLSDGSVFTARIPSGVSTGLHEANELRDYGSKFAEEMYKGNSVHQACANINEILAPILVGRDPDLTDADRILRGLDETEGFQAFGANAALAVSIAVAQAQARACGNSLARLFQPAEALQLPMPMVNILSGGAHAQNTLDIQDVLIIPHGASSFGEAMGWVSAIREMAALAGAQQGAPTYLTADEGGLAIELGRIESACEFVSTCISAVGLQVGRHVSLAIDFAATQFYKESKYHLIKSNSEYTSAEFVPYIQRLVTNQPIISIEDPFAEDDWVAWSEFMKGVPSNLQVIGDDLYTTNLARLDRGIKEQTSNAILIKPNQNGLLSSTRKVLERAQINNFRTIVSGRSGETEDSWLVDLAVGWRAGQIKVGSTHGSERTAKWNRLLELEATETCEFSQPFEQ